MSALTVTVWRNGRHVYALNGERIPGVTTCLGQLAKPALVNAAAREAAIWAANNPDQLTALGHETFVKTASEAPRRVWDEAATLGRDIHAHADKLATTGEAPDVPEAQLPYVMQAADFLDSMGVETIASERACWHESFFYAGRYDLVATIRGSIWLLDFKTGKSGVWPEMALQQAAYRFCTHQQGPAADSEDEPMPPIAHCGIVWVRPEGWQLVPVRADRDVWQAFLATLPLYQFSRIDRDELVAAPWASGSAPDVKGEPDAD